MSVYGSDPRDTFLTRGTQLTKPQWILLKSSFYVLWLKSFGKNHLWIFMMGLWQFEYIVTAFNLFLLFWFWRGQLLSEVAVFSVLHLHLNLLRNEDWVLNDRLTAPLAFLVGMGWLLLTTLKLVYPLKGLVLNKASLQPSILKICLLLQFMKRSRVMIFLFLTFSGNLRNWVMPNQFIWEIIMML